MTWTKLGAEFFDDCADRGLSDAAVRTHVEAIGLRAKARIEVDLGEGTWRDPRRGDLRFAAWAADWIQTRHDLRPTTRGRLQTTMQNQVLPAFGSMPLTKITNGAVRKWVAAMLDSGLSAATVPMFRGTISREVWRPAVTRAGLADLTFHGLRHSFVAIMVAAGCNVREVSEWAGHHSVGFTLTRYGGLFEDSSDAAIDRLDALLGADPEPLTKITKLH
jgi:integrase